MVKRPQKSPIKTPNPHDGPYNPTVSPDQQLWIGKIVVEWAKLESCLDDLIWAFFDLPMEFGRLITQRMDATGKITLLRSLSELCFDGKAYDLHLKDYLKEFVDTFDILREDRNFIVHGTWGTNPFGVPIAMSLRVKADPSWVVSETFPWQRMRHIYAGILIAKVRFYRLLPVAQASHSRARERFRELLASHQPNLWDQTD